MDLSGKVAAVTGGARGLGKAYTEALLQRKAKVAVIDISEETGQSTVEELEKQYGQGCAIFLMGDVQNQQCMEDAYSHIMSKLGRLDILINNAGVGGPQFSADMTVGVNTLGLIRSTELAIKHMRRDEGGNGGTIINIGSIAGYNVAPGDGLYCASKFGSVSYTLCRARGMPSEYGIKMVCVNPTFVMTDMTADFKKMEDEGNPKVKAVIESMGGWVPLEAVVDCVLRCLGDDVKHGASVLVSGDGINYIKHEIKKTPFP